MSMWTEDIAFLSKIRELRDSGLEWQTIYRRISPKAAEQIKSPENLRKRFSEHEFKLDDSKWQVSLSSEISFDEAYSRICKIIRMTKLPKPPKRRKSSLTRILVLSDPHCPFQNDITIQKILTLCKDFDIVVIAGDLYDCYSVSRFAKDMNISLADEIQAGFTLVRTLANLFPEVYILKGNHDDRVRKHVVERLGPSFLPFVNHDLVKLAAKDLPNVHLLNHSVESDKGMGNFTLDYVGKVGKDLLVTHFEDSSKVPFKVVNDRIKWIEDWDSLLKFGDVKMMLQAHTHQLGKAPVNGGTVMLGETGCVCQIQGYALKANSKYRAGVNGYWTVYQEDSETLLNESNFHVV